MTQHTNEWDGEREEYTTVNASAQDGEAGGPANDETDGAQAKAERGDIAEMNGPRKASRTPAKRAQSRKRAASGGESATEGTIIPLPVRSHQPAEPSDEDMAVAELEAQGFTEDEAIRLISVSDRIATSKEARDAEATLRRLRFTRWLVERGVLDEFSA